MKSLKGFSDYRKTRQPPSVFGILAQNGEQAVFRRYDGTELAGVVTENAVYDLKIRFDNDTGEATETVMPKLEIIIVYRPEDRENIRKHRRASEKGSTSPAEPLRRNADRHHIKNKTLYTLMEERQVAGITVLDGTVLRGLISGFNAYEIMMSLKDGTPVTVLRHGVLNARTKTDRSLLKVDQEKYRDWKKSPLYVEQKASC